MLERGRIGHRHGSRRRKGHLGDKITGNAGRNDVISIVLGLDDTDLGEIVGRTDTVDGAHLVGRVCGPGKSRRGRSRVQFHLHVQ